MTIEIHERPSAALVALARSFAAATETSQGCYGERDPAWLDVLHDGLGHRPFLLLARDGGGVNGYLPLALVSSRLFGRFLVGLPYVTHAGVLAADDGVAASLRDAAIDLAARLDVDHLELRELRPNGDPRFAVTRGDKVRMTRSLPSDADALWRDLGNKVRNQIRKGERAALAARFGGAELLDAFYKVLAENMRDLGSPVYPRRLFAAMLAMPGRAAEIGIVERNGRTAAAAIMFHGVRGAEGDATTSVLSAGCRRAERANNANMWMYHRLMLRALERESAEFDFGRSTAGSGPHRFKRQWGCRQLPTCWHYHVRRGDPAALRADDPRHARRVAAWKNLPLWLSRALGPLISRGIP
jgi:serine/alanine adding enzyme